MRWTEVDVEELQLGAEQRPVLLDAFAEAALALVHGVDATPWAERGPAAVDPTDNLLAPLRQAAERMTDVANRAKALEKLSGAAA